MSDEHGQSLRLPDVVDLLREDAAAAELRGIRQLDAMEQRVMTAITETRTELAQYVTVHAGDHSAMRSTSEAAHARFDDYIRATALTQARRDGALGMVRWAIELVGRNWRGVLALAAAIAALTGAVRIDIGF